MGAFDRRVRFGMGAFAVSAGLLAACGGEDPAPREAVGSTSEAVKWVQQQRLEPSSYAVNNVDRYGSAVAVDGSYALVGSPYLSASDYGRVYFWERTGSTWTAVATTGSPINSRPGDTIGMSVAIKGTYAVLGAPGADLTFSGDEDVGRAFLFERVAGVWTYTGAKAEGAANEKLGYRLGFDGQRLVAGSGTLPKASVYKLIAGSLSFEGSITLACGIDCWNPMVAVDGNTVVLGAMGEDISGNENQGAVYVYVYDGASWNLQQKIVAPDGGAEGAFGSSVAVQGNTLLVGAYYQNAAYVFVRSGTTWSLQQKLTTTDLTNLFGAHVSLDGELAVVGSPGSDSYKGAAYVFARSGSTWTQQQKVVASDGVAGDAFGVVALRGGALVAGAPSASPGGKTYAGAAYAFTLVGTACSSGADCTSGHCVDGVCCDSACAGGCDTCKASLGASEDGVCTILPTSSTPASCAAPKACNGTDATCISPCNGDFDCALGYYCAAGGTCVAQKSLGATCNTTSDCTAPGCRVCTSGNCVDGVCCNTLCNSACDVCSVAAGGPANGTCSTAPTGIQTADCGADKACNGTSLVCVSPCLGDADCAATHFCHTNGSCTPRKTQGSGCSLAAGNDCKTVNCRVCQSNFCVDGYCCNTACTDQCGTCSAAAQLGTCSPVADGASPDAPGCAGYLCNGATVSCPGTCGGDGDCATSHYCSGGQCLPKACLSDANCATTHYCAETGFCTPRKGQGEFCNQAPGANCKTAGCRVCASDNCVDGYCCNTPCTELCASCGLSGKEGTCSAKADAAIPDSPGCSGYLCNGTSLTCPTTCAGNQDCAPVHYCNGTSCLPSGCGSDSDCSADRYCAANGLCTPRKPQGTGCNAAATQDCMVGGCRVCQSNNCVDGFCCDTPCSEACGSCNLTAKEGTCSPHADNSVPELPGCSGYLCGGTAVACPTSCANDTDCATTHYCSGNQCLPKACSADTDCAAAYFCSSSGNCAPRKGQGAACNVAVGGDCKVGGCRACQSNNCVDGYCCNTPCSEACASCGLSTKEGTCSALADGTVPDAPGCGGYLCGGTLLACPTSCANDTDCAATHYCSGTQCLPKACNTDTDCAATHYCPASGSCTLRKGQGSACNVAAGADCKVAGCHVCQSNNCVDGYCCSGPCSDPCATCAGSTPGLCSALADGAPPDAPGCSGYLCNGTSQTCVATCAGDVDCASTHYCSGGACVPKKNAGESCTSSSQCGQIGYLECADGVCCDTKCDGTCLACAAGNKQSGSGSGTCGAAKQGTNPNNGCILSSDPCGAQASCSGVAGQCAKAPFGKACGPTSCAGGAVSGKVCDGTGTCIDQTNAQCSPYVCASGACSSPCASSNDCVANYYCSSGACVPQSDNGKGCTSAGQCKSGFCVDAVCCDAPCGGQCQACAEPGTLGQCKTVGGAPRGSRPACAGTGSCQGSCDGANPTACTLPGSSKSCGVSQCTGDVSQPAAFCDGSGGCTVPVTKNCAPYACDSSSGACKATCAGDGDCSLGAKCDTSSGQCTVASATCTDAFTVKLGNGQTQSCVPYKCVGGACQQQCTVSGDCAPGYECQANSCVAAEAGSGGSGGAGGAAGAGGLTGGGSGGATGGSSGTGASGGKDAGPSGGAGGGVDAGGGTAGAGTGGASKGGGESDSGGCGCRVPREGSPSNAAAWLALLLAAAGLRRARKPAPTPT